MEKETSYNLLFFIFVLGILLRYFEFTQILFYMKDIAPITVIPRRIKM